MSKPTRVATNRGELLPASTVLPRVNRRYAIGAACACAIWACFAAAEGLGRAAASDDVPAWLRQAAAANVPAYDKKVPGVVLADEARVTVDDQGRVTNTWYFAIRLLSREGRERAVASKVYNTDTEKVKDLRAWLIKPSGEPKRYSKDQVIDRVLADDDVYDEARIKEIIASGDADAGMVFGFECTMESKSVFTQSEWFFQHRWPVIASRFVLTVPSGWRAEGVTFNHSKVEPSVAGSTYTWELRDLPYIDEEPGDPSLTYLAPWLAVSYFPPEGRATLGKSFTKWSDVSRWLSELADPQSSPNDAITAKAQSLVSGAASELDRIRAIGRYVQNVHYISIQTGIGRGGGYRPHLAADVLTKSYGDCKDKANLMRAMLKAVGITSYPVTIFSGDPYYVREEWPSPQQFNHCIIAVKVKDETQTPTVINHPALGRLLIFDPTDDDTPVGDLPFHEQGSLALIVAGDAGSLTRMPLTPPEANRLDRQIEATLGPDGALSASLREQAVGQGAARFRALFHHLAKPDLTKYIERWVSYGAKGAAVAKIEPSDDATLGRFSLDVQFTSGSYGQLMQGRLLVFKPAIVGRREALSLVGSSRKHPVRLESEAFGESVHIKLPSGFEVDELPDPVKLDTPFGKYSATYEVKEGSLLFKRSLVTRAATIPVEQYPAVRGFFERIRAAEQSPVVLAKK
jgi:transglutaminase-like putative cysteine protease